MVKGRAFGQHRASEVIGTAPFRRNRVFFRVSPRVVEKYLSSKLVILEDCGTPT